MLPVSAGGAVVVGLLLLLCTQPVVDSDLWFHLAYARQMVASGSLVVDHTMFSWTPSDNRVIYCAWIAQLVFLRLFVLFGLPGLFALRYTVFVAALAVVVWYARRVGALWHPLVPVSAALALLMSSGAVFIKPQLASYLLMATLVVIVACIRQRTAWSGALAWTLPLLMLLWVNTHGGFVVGLAYLATEAASEALNRHWSPAHALPPDLTKRLLSPFALAFAATFVTPYGWHYPLQFLTVDLPASDLRAVRDYDSIFADAQRSLHYAEYGTMAAAILLTLVAGRSFRRGVDWSLLVPNAVFAFLYTYYARLTFFWAPLFLLSVLRMLSDRRGWTWPTSAARARMVALASLVLTATLAAHAAYAQRSSPVVGSWVGFGNGYWNPEAEAEYIAQHFPVERVGNDYNSGGYLIWRLWPQTQVFMDARYFPYRSWFQEYLTLEDASGLPALLQKYSADVWCVQLHLSRTVSWFRSSPDWQAAFYGPSAVVFVRRGQPLPGGRLQASAAIGDIRNLYQALVVLAFAFDVGDLANAERVVQGMELRFQFDTEPLVVSGARRAVDGLSAHARGDHALAVRLLTEVASAYQGAPAKALTQSAASEMARLWSVGNDTEAQQMALLALRFAPQSPVAQYNAGAAGWWLQRKGLAGADGSWRLHLQTFLRGSASADPTLGWVRASASQMLAGEQTQRPSLLVGR